MTKLPALRQFSRDVQNYQLLPSRPASVFAVVLPFVELSIAILLFVGFQVAWAASATLVLIAVFMIAVGVAIARSQNLNCSCFGLLYRERVGWSTQIRDAIFAMMGLVVIAFDDGSLTLFALSADSFDLSYVAGWIITGFAVALSVGAGLWNWKALQLQNDRTRYHQGPPLQTILQCPTMAL